MVMYMYIAGYYPYPGGDLELDIDDNEDDNEDDSDDNEDDSKDKREAHEPKDIKCPRYGSVSA